MEFLKEKRLQWFGHVERIDDERAPVKAKKFVVCGSKKGRTKKKLKVVVEKDQFTTYWRRSKSAQKIN